MPFIIACVTFVTVLVGAVIIWRYFAEHKQGVSGRVDKYLSGYKETAPSASPLALPTGKPLSGVRGLIRRLSKYFESPQWAKLLEHKLIQAGLPLRGSEFLVICSGMALMAALLLFLLAGRSIAAAVYGAAIGFGLPVLVLRIKVQRRLRQFNAQLGDVLILIANSLRTGYSFLQSIEMVSREMPPPISIEFGRLLKEMNLGVVAEDALNNMAKRMNSDDLDLVVTAVVIQRQVGGNLAEILDNIANTIRERVKIKGEIKTLTAQGKVSGIIICLLPICLGFIIYLMNPEYIRVLFIHPLGKMMLIGAVVSQIFGIIMIRKVVSIDV